MSEELIKQQLKIVRAFRRKCFWTGALFFLTGVPERVAEKQRKRFVDDMEMAAYTTMDTAPKDVDICGMVNGKKTVIRWGKTSHVPLYGWIDVLAITDVENVLLCKPSGWMPMSEDQQDRLKQVLA